MCSRLSYRCVVGTLLYFVQGVVSILKTLTRYLTVRVSLIFGQVILPCRVSVNGWFYCVCLLVSSVWFNDQSTLTCCTSVKISRYRWRSKILNRRKILMSIKVVSPDGFRKTLNKILIYLFGSRGGRGRRTRDVGGGVLNIYIQRPLDVVSLCE